MGTDANRVTFIDLVGEALAAEFRAFPTLHLSRDAECAPSSTETLNWVSRRSEQASRDVVFLGVSDETLKALAGALGADSHPDPSHHAARTVSTLLQSSLARVARRVAELVGSPTLDVDNGSGSPEPTADCVASYSLTWEQESGQVLLAASKSIVDLWEQELKTTEEPERKPEMSGKPSTNNLLLSVEMPVTLSLGSTHVTFGEVLGFGGGSIIKLGCPIDAPVDIIVGGKTIARGTVVSVEGMYGVKVSEVLFDQSVC